MERRDEVGTGRRKKRPSERLPAGQGWASLDGTSAGAGAPGAEEPGQGDPGDKRAVPAGAQHAWPHPWAVSWEGRQGAGVLWGLCWGLGPRPPARPPARLGEAGSGSGVPPAWHPPGGSENVPAVGANGIDGAVVAFDLADGREVVHVPDLDDTRTAGAQQHGAAWDEGQCAHPVLVCSGDLLGKERAVRAGSGDPDPACWSPLGGRGRAASQGLERGSSAPILASNLRPRTTEESFCPQKGRRKMG